MAAEDDVVYKVNANVDSLLQALVRIQELLASQQLQFQKYASGGFEAFTKVNEGVETTTKALTTATTLGTFFGTQLSKAFDGVVHGVTEAVTALPELISRTAEAADRFGVMSQQTGVSTEALSQFDYVAQQAGTSIETINNSIFLMSRNLGSGTKSSRDAIKDLGLSFEALQTSAPEDAFQTIIEGLGRIPNSAEKARIGMELFGRNFRSIAQLTKEDMKGLMQEADEMGLSISQSMAKMGDRLNDARNKMSNVWKGLENQIGFALLPAVTKVTEGVVKIFQDFIKKLNINTAQWGVIADQGADQIIAAFQQLADALEPLAKMILEAIQGTLKVLPSVIDAFTKSVKFAVPILELFADILKTLGPTGTVLVGVLITLSDHFDLVTKAVNFASKALIALAETKIGTNLATTGVELTGIATKAEGVGGVLTKMFPTFLAWGKSLTGVFTGLGATIAESTTGWLATFIGGAEGAATATGIFAASLTTLGIAAVATGGFLAGWKLGEWIGEVTGATDATERWFGVLFGASDASVAATQAARKAAKAAQDEADARDKAGKKLLEDIENRHKAAADLNALAIELNNTEKLTDEVILSIAASAASLKAQGAPISAFLEDLIKKAAEAREAAKTKPGPRTETQEDKDKVIDLERETNKVRLQIVKEGVAQRLAIFDLESKAQIDKMKASGTYPTVVAAQEALNRANRRKIEFDEEKKIADQIAAIRQDEFVQQINRDKRGLEAKLAAIKASGEFEIEQLRANGESEEILEEKAAKIKVDQASAVAEAVRASEDGIVETRRQARLLEIKLTKDGTEQQLALLEEETQKQIEENVKKNGDTEAYYVDLIRITNEYENKRREIIETNNKRAEEAVLAAQSQIRQQAIDLQLTGVKAAQAKEDEAYNEKIRRMDKEANHTQEEYDVAEEAHRLSLEKIEADDRKIYGNIDKDAEVRGFETRKRLEQKARDEEATYRRMKAAGTRYTKEEIEEQRQRAKEAANHAGLVSHLADKMMEAYAGVSDGLRRLGTVGGETFKSLMNGMADLIETTMAAGQAAGAFTDGFDKLKGGDIAGGIAGIASGIGGMVQAMDKATDSASRTKRALGGLMAGAQMGAKIGGMFGPMGAMIGLGVGAVAGLVTGLIRGKPEWAKAAADIGRDMGVKISDNLAKAIEATEKKEKVGRLAASLMHLQEIIGEAGGLSDKNVAKFGQQLHNAFSEMERGQLTADQLTKILTDNLDAFAELATTSEEGMNQFADAAQLTFAKVKSGQLTAAQASKALGNGFKILADDALKNGKIVSQTFLDMAKQAKAAGVQLEGLTQFNDAMFSKMASGMKAAVSKLPESQKAIGDLFKTFSKAQQDQLKKDYEDYKKTGKVELTFEDFITKQADYYNELEENDKRLNTVFYGDDLTKYNAAKKNWQGSFDRLSRIALASFNSMVASGKSAFDAIGELGDSIDTLANRQEKLGLKSNAAFDQLSRLRKLTVDNKELVESVGGLNDVMVALANTGSLDADTFKDLQDEGVDSFKKLTAAGFSEQEARAQLKPLMENIIKLHKERGLAIDDETAKMIAQAQEEGTLGAEQASVQDTLKEGLGALIKTLGGELPAAWAKSAKAAQEAAADTATATGTVNKSLKDQQTNLDKTDWSGWAQDAVIASDRAKGAIDRVTYGASPGGLVDMFAKLKDAKDASQDFALTLLKSLRAAKGETIALTDEQEALAKKLLEGGVAPLLMKKQELAALRKSIAEKDAKDAVVAPVAVEPSADPNAVRFMGDWKASMKTLSGFMSRLPDMSGAKGGPVDVQASENAKRAEEVATQTQAAAMEVAKSKAATDEKMQTLVGALQDAADASGGELKVVLNDNTTYGTQAHVENDVLPNLISLLVRGKGLREMQRALEIDKS